MFNRSAHRARKPMGGEKKASLREALRNRGGAQAAAIVTPAQTDVEDEFDLPEKSGLDWLNLTAFAPKNLQAVIDKLRTDNLPTAVRGQSDAEGGKVSSARPTLRQDVASSESEEADPMVKVPSLRGSQQQPNGALPAPAGKRKSGIRAALQARGGMQRAAGSTIAAATTTVEEEAPETSFPEVDVELNDQDVELSGGLPASPSAQSPLASSPLPSLEEEAEEEAEVADEDGVGVGVFVEPPGQPEAAETDSAEEPQESAADLEPRESREPQAEDTAEEAAEEQLDVVQEDASAEEAEAEEGPAEVEAVAATVADDTEEEQALVREEEMDSEEAGGAPEEAAPSEKEEEEAHPEDEDSAHQQEEVPAASTTEVALEEQPEDVAEVEASQALEVAETASASEPLQPQGETAEATDDLAPSAVTEQTSVPEEEARPEAPAPVAVKEDVGQKPQVSQELEKVVKAPAPVATKGDSEVKPQAPPESKKVVEAAKKQIERANTESKLQHFNQPLPKLAEGAELPPLPWRSSKLTNRRHTLGTLNEDDQPAKEASQVQPTKSNNIKEIKEFWGKNAKGFAGPAIGATSRLSKCEAQATLQRLIAAGGAVDFDEVRRLRKMIAELD